MKLMRLAIFATHPVQYYAPLFRTLAREIDLEVFYGHRGTPHDQAVAGFGQAFEWDVDLLSGYRHSFLTNAARCAGLESFSGIDSPGLANILREGEWSAVLLLGWYRKMLIQALVAAKRLGIPVMARGDSQLHGCRPLWKRALKRVAYPVFLRQFDAGLVVGRRNRAYWRHYGYPEGRLFDSPHCVDNEWFAERATSQSRAALRAEMGIPQDASVVLFAGKLVPLKNPITTVDVVAAMRRNGRCVELMIAGAGPLEHDLRERAAELEVPLHMMGFRNQSEMPAVYSAADVLLLPSTEETWGLVVNEALACGCPVAVADKVGCGPDLASDGITGRTFATGDVADCARAIAELLDAHPGSKAVRRLSSAGSLGDAANGIVKAARFAMVGKGRE
jgi:glycosyltransferase involved in cell wall biosynthesis